jgi:hypothetical protein
LSAGSNPDPKTVGHDEFSFRGRIGIQRVAQTEWGVLRYNDPVLALWNIAQDLPFDIGNAPDQNRLLLGCCAGRKRRCHACCNQDKSQPEPFSSIVHQFSPFNCARHCS